MGCNPHANGDALFGELSSRTPYSTDDFNSALA